jgi:hypothetical protein
MKQRYEIYTSPDKSKKDIDKLAKDGWFVHAIAGTGHGFDIQVYVVYRKE